MLLRIALALTILVTPVIGQTLEPESGAGQGANPSEIKPVPWLVTILYELSVKDLISEWRAEGLAVTPLDGVSESQLITNVTSGLVMTDSGRILGRLANFQVKPKPDRLTVITNDGRRLKPKSVEYDQASGYTVLEVPDLAIEPPPFASAFVLSQHTDGLRLLYQIPDWVHLQFTPRESGLAQAAQAKAQIKQETLTIRQSEKPTGPSVSVRVIEDVVQAPVDARERVETGTNRAIVEFKRLNAPDGSVVLNPKGEVIGLMEFLGSAKGIVKSIEELRSLANRLVTREQVRRGWIGVRLAQLPADEVKNRFGPEAARNPSLVVREVFPDSPAAKADVKTEDWLCSFNGQEMQNLRDLTQAIAQTAVGTEVSLEMLRDGEIRQLKVRIEPRPRLVPAEARRSRNVKDSYRAESKSGVDSRMKSRAVRRADRLARLGIRVEVLTPALREFFGVSGSGGVLVTEVEMDGLAGQAGLRAGDVIVAVNGNRVVSQHQLETLLARTSRVGKTTLSLSRHRQPAEITLDLSKPF